MPKQVQWPRRSRSPNGTRLKMASLKFEPAFLTALKEYSDQEGVSQAVVLQTLALKTSADLRELFKAARATKQ